jgi:hypothetical protein
LDKAYLGENPKAPQTLNATPCLANTTLNSLTRQLLDLRELLYLLSFLRDSIAGNQRYLKIKISPTEKCNR